MDITDLDSLITDITDDFWKNRIRNSVLAVAELYDLSLADLMVSRESIHPQNIFIAAVEECVLVNAKKHLENKFGINTPLTVLRHNGKNVLFMGSSRSLMYLLMNKSPDCLVVNLPEHLNPKIVSEASITLQEIYVNQLTV